MKKLVIAFIFFTLHTNINAQSVEKLYNNKLPIAKINVSKKEANVFLDTTIILSKSSNVYNENNKHKKAKELNNKAEAAFKKGFILEAEKINNELAMLANALNDTLLIINTINRKGLIALERGNNAEGEKLFLLGLDLSKNNASKTAEIYSNLGSMYLAKGDKEEASKYFFKALDLFEQANNLQGIGETYSNISSVHYLMGKADKAIDYQTKGIAAREIANDKNGLVIAYNNLSQLYLLKGNNDLSLIQVKQAVAYAEALQNPKLLGVAYGGMTTYYSYTKNYDNALQWQTKAIKLYENIEDKQQLSRLYVSAANLANAMNDSTLALQYFDKALAVSKAINNKENIGNVYEKMSNYYASHNDHKNALKNYKIFLVYKDSINAKSNLAKIEEIKTQYETEKKDNEIAKLQIQQKIKTLQIEKQEALIIGNKLLAKEKETQLQLLFKEADVLAKNSELQKLKIAKQDELLEKQQLITKNNEQQIAINNTQKTIKENELNYQKKIKNLLLAGLLLSIIITILFVNRWQLKKKFEQQKALLQIRNSISNDLHDEIGSTLTSISILSNVSNLALEKQPLQAKEMIQQIAIQSKAIQQSMSDIVWSIRPENENIDNLTTRIREYAAQTLEPLQISASISLDDNMQNQKLSMHYRKELLLICKEAINNIAKHSGATKASVLLQKNNQHILLLISDNGQWKGSTTGTGNKSMAERAATLGGVLQINGSKAGTKITATIPIP